MYELLAIEISLRPRKHNRIPYWQGRAAQAMFYASLHQIHPMIAETIHDLYKWHPRIPKPFTMSSILGAEQIDDLIQLRPTQIISLRLTTLHPHLTSIVQHGVLPMWLRHGFSLHDQPLQVFKITEHARVCYDDLLPMASDDPHIRLSFLSPTAFKKTEGSYYPEPDIAYIFMSILDRWNAFADPKLPDSLREIIRTQIRVIRSDTTQETLAFDRGRKGIIPGFKGEVEAIIESPSATVRQMIQTLAHYALFSGVGIKTTVGMGQVRAG